MSALPQQAAPCAAMATATAPLLDVRDLSKSFRLRDGLLPRKARLLRAVADVSFSVRAGETLGIVGESGCGKSTLARLLVRLETADAGAMRLGGIAIAAGRAGDMRAFRRQVQMVFQDSGTSLNPRMTAGQIVAYGPRIHGVSRHEAADIANRMLDAVGLHPAVFAGRFPHQLSGGQKQRVNIARALAIGPKLLVLDESVSALDKSVEAQILDLLQRLKRDLGLTYLFISHDLHTVRFISERVMVMYLGRVVEIADTADLYERPLHPYTRALLQARLSPHEVRPLTEPLAGELPSPLAIPEGCPFRTRCIHAEDVCTERRPALLPQERGRVVACHIHERASGHSLSGQAGSGSAR